MTMVSFDDFLKEQLREPEFRSIWERTALARAVAIEVIRYRSEHGLSQTALARRLGVSQAVVGRLELGEHEPKIATLSRLSWVLGLRFTIDIHPDNQESARADDPTIARVVSNGVELVVSAS
jgi:ribosome-binding protein aMBF1 (putative translation factor)